jgi:hypothetical protein
VLKLPVKIADFIVRAQAIHDAMAANTATIPSPNPTLAILAAHLADLSTKEAAAKLRATGAVGDRDAAKKVVATDLGNERAYVESLVNNNPENAATIAGDAGMELRKVPVRSKTDLAAKPGKVSGTVQVVAKATKGAKANEWQYSVDGGKTWVDLPITTKATTSVPNLTVGTTVAFRQRVLTVAGLANWSQPVSTTVV